MAFNLDPSDFQSCMSDVVASSTSTTTSFRVCSGTLNGNTTGLERGNTKQAR